MGYNLDNVHRCYLDYIHLEEGATSGTHSFGVDVYKEVGEYEVRFFRGDSLDGGGLVCRGVANVEGTVVQCVYEAAVVSEAITIIGDLASLEVWPTDPLSPIPKNFMSFDGINAD